MKSRYIGSGWIPGVPKTQRGADGALGLAVVRRHRCRYRCASQCLQKTDDNLARKKGTKRRPRGWCIQPFRMRTPCEMVSIAFNIARATMKAFFQEIMTGELQEDFNRLLVLEFRPGTHVFAVLPCLGMQSSAKNRWMFKQAQGHTRRIS